MEMTEKAPKPKAASRVTLTQLMLPHHANALGHVHGGVIMRMVDETAAIAAMRHAHRPCVTVAIDSMTFRERVEVGALLSCTAMVNYVGRTSMEVGVKVSAENPITGETTHTNSAYLVFVALGEDDRPCTVPELTLESDDDRRRFEEGEERQQYRLAQRQKRARVRSAPDEP
jgi:acyl-CoA hydrolase